MSGAEATSSSPGRTGPGGPASFPTTQWSRILAARGSNPATAEARGALAELCRAYWYPLYVFIRRRGHDPDSARDLTQEFFTRLIEADFLAGVERAKGKFRAFLLAPITFTAVRTGREAIRSTWRPVPAPPAAGGA
jgi:RNA polymerase sigma-70 factor (ECF subfamily)